ncbi:TPA: glycosyltransferase family 4 protein [Methanosarcinaceae archaeon]|nr:glycosyltransferase family 4 protein [Methanosarcinaceae archaeon]
MKICIMSAVHSPFDTRMYYKIGKSLSNKHEITIIAPHNKKIDEEIEGIHIITIPETKKKTTYPFTIINLFFAALKADCDAYQCELPSTLLVGVIIKILKRKKVVYDMRDYYPTLIAENAIFPDRLKPLIRVASMWCERFLCMFADFIITVDDVMKFKYKDYNKNIITVSNYPKKSLFIRKEGREKDKKENSVVYVGGLIKYKGIFESIKAIEIVRNEIPDVKMVFIGKFNNDGFKEEVTPYIKEQKLEENIVFTGWVPHGETIKYLEKANVGLVLLQPIERYIHAISVKLFEYMACGIPVIASDFPEMRAIVEENNCGITVDPTNIMEISDAIIELLKDPQKEKKMGENGRRAVEEKYNWENMEKRLFGLYEELA